MTVGVLLINTGTPDEPTIEAIRPYLTEFLMDPAIIGAPYFVRKPLVKHIASTRPLRTVKRYQAFWTPEGSPFMLTSRAQQQALAQELGPDVCVELAMRYGNPGIRPGLEALREAGCTTVVAVPLYPQNVSACAGTCLKEVRTQLAELAKEGWRPDLREVLSFHDQPAYRHALANSVRKAWTPEPGAKLLVSFHSTILKDIQRDPTYLEQTTQNKNWLCADLGLSEDDVILCFQSRFDSRKWLQPFTEHVLDQLAMEGTVNVCVVCPGFVADNLETSVEVNMEMRERFLQAAQAAGASRDQVSFTYVPALGSDPGLISALTCAIKDAL